MYARPVWIEVDLDAIQENTQTIRKLVKGADIMAVVKADAYGHGIVQVARAVLNGGASSLGVATLDEAIELREAGFAVPILIFGYSDPRYTELLVTHNLTQTVYDLETAAMISKLALKSGKLANVHVKIDTGMNRLGIKASDAVSFMEEIGSYPGIKVKGIYSHFATADKANKSYAYEQIRLFTEVKTKLNERYDVKWHICNSAGVLELAEAWFDLVRPGIILYGIYPSQEVKRNIALKPALTLKAKIVHLKTVPSGTRISYGGSYITRCESRIATVPIGYADGLPRSLSNHGEALIKGKRVKIAGTICMDYCMLDVTGIEGVTVGDEVVFIGAQDGDCITAAEVADKCKTIPYEIISRLGKRLPRSYWESVLASNCVSCKARLQTTPDLSRGK